MLVSMQSDGHSITGIRMGMSDARRFFPQGLRSVDLELDHLRIQCDVRATESLDRAEISDPRLTAWLNEKLYWQKLPRTPVSAELVKSGKCAYRLKLTPSSETHNPGFGLIV
jgi:hypothetical protein